MGRVTFGWFSAELLETRGSLGGGGESVLLRLELPFEPGSFTGRFKYISKLDEVVPVSFLPFDLPLKRQSNKIIQQTFIKTKKVITLGM